MSVGHRANEQSGPPRPTTVFPSGQIIASVVQPCEPLLLLLLLLPPLLLLPQELVVHAMPCAVHEHWLQPSSDGNVSPTVWVGDGSFVTTPTSNEVPLHEQIDPRIVGEPSVCVTTCRPPPGMSAMLAVDPPQAMTKNQPTKVLAAAIRLIP